MPRDIFSDSLAALKIVEQDEEKWPLENNTPYKQSNKKPSQIPLNSQQPYTKDDCACYYNYAHGENGSGRQHDLSYQYKTSSLPPASSINQTWDKIVCSALRIAPEDIANQLTLLDLPCFKSIRPEELTACGWTKMNKVTVAPNVVAFTKRFNRVSFWTVQEILNGQSPKSRAEILAHFIKIGKKLHELNNLHSLFALVSALLSASIYRLTKTWACLSKKDKQQFDKLAELFGEKDNWMVLREYLKTTPLPCIPYLGIFLTDLVYIDIAHPAGSPHRTAKMAVVLKALQRYQTSTYDIAPLPLVANFLNSVRYIEELQKFVEDDQYKLSLKLEPPSPVGSCSGSKESVKEVMSQVSTNTFTISPSHKLGSGSLRLQGSCQQLKFVPTHRKCRSLGTNETSETADIQCDFQGFVRRKTILKDGRKISLSSWQRYWLQISRNVLIFYAAKSFIGTNRSDFRDERCKMLTLDGWLAKMVTGDAVDAFQLINEHTGTVYKFKATSESAAKSWVSKIEEVTNKTVKPLPANLMSFE